MSIIASAILAVAVPWASLSNETNATVAATSEEVSVLTKSEQLWLCDMERKIDVLYAAHTNRLAKAEQRKTATAESQSAIERVKENKKNRKRRSSFGKSAGGVK